MKNEDALLLALEFITEGKRAHVPAALSRETFSTESFVTETESMKKRYRPWTQGAGIQGMGIGAKETEGKLDESHVALRVYVKEKKPLSKVKNKVPKKVDVPEVGEVETDVVEIGQVEAEVFTSKLRPAIPGVGLGHTKVSVGTFGCLVRKRNRPNGPLYILSNSHVLANEGFAKAGDNIIQPGRHDGGRSPKDNLAKLTEWVPFDFSSTGYPNLVDAAIARVAPSRVDKAIRLLGVPPAGVSKTVRRGMFVQKVGRTTDHTTGIIRDVNYRLALRYKRPTGKSEGRVGLRDQVLCSRYTAGGDSGSAVLNRSKRVVGLHFAGSPSTSIFNKIGNVFTLLDLELA